METAVTLAHRPSGIVVRCQEERSQWQNRRRARLLLAERLESLARQQAASKRHAAERLKRQKRGRSKKAKARMLADKRHRAGVKSARRRAGEGD